MKRSALFAATAIFIFVSSAFAQDFKSEVSIQGAANIPKNSDTIDIPHHATDSGGFLLGYRVHLNPWFAVQGDYGYTRDTQKYFDPVLGESDVQSNIHQLTGEALITAPAQSRIRPYALAGVGGLFFRPTNSVNNAFIGVGNGVGNQTKAAFVYGGGVDFELTRYLALRAEYRGYLYKIPDFQIPGLASDNFTHLAQPSVGLVWRF